MQRVFLSLILILSLSLSLSSPGLADDRLEHGDWSSQFMEGMGEATTHENGMSTFGVLCGNGSCRYYFANSIDCQPGGNYPLMITTDSGALSVEGVCEPVGTANGDIMVYWFNESDAMSRAFRDSPVVGFAFPLTSGKFKISTFSMNGYNAAVERMVEGIRSRPQPEAAPKQDLEMEIQEATPEAAPGRT